MKVLFAIGNAAVSEEVKKQYYALYDEKIESKDVFYFKAILEEVKRDKSYDRIVIAEQLEPMQNNVVDANDQVIFNNIDSITDEIEDSTIIFICADNRTKSDNLIGRLFNIGIYNVLMGDERQPKQLCSLIREPRNKKEAKEYLHNNPAIRGDSVATPDEGVDERELLNIVNYFDKLRTPEEYLKSFGDVAEQQYSDEDLTIIVATLTTKLSRGNEIFETLAADARYSKYCKWNKNGTVPEQKSKSGILGFLKNNKKMLINDFGNMKEKIKNRKKEKEQKEKSDNPFPDTKSSNDIEEQIKSLQEAQNKLLEEQRKQNEEILRKQQEDINEKMRQEAIARQQQEAFAKQQRENLLKQQQEAYARQQQEAIAKQQQEELLKQQQEAIAKQQQEAFLKQQQEAIAKQQQEALLKQQQEAIAKQQQEAFIKQQQEAIAKQQQEALLKQQQEALLKQQQEAIAKQQQEAFLKQQQEAIAKQQVDENPIRDDNSRYSVIGTVVGGVVEGVNNIISNNTNSSPTFNAEMPGQKNSQDNLSKAQQQAIYYAQKEAKYKGAQAEAERKAQEEKARKANEEMARRLQAESAMKAQQEAQRIAQEEQVRKAQEEARLQAQKEAEEIKKAQEASFRNQQSQAMANMEAEIKAKYQAQLEELNKQKELLLQQQEELRQQQEAFQVQQNSFVPPMNVPPMGHGFGNPNDFVDGPDTFAQGLPSFSSLNISKDYKKVIAFVGTNKVGTSFMVNSVANVLAQKGVKTSILDMTKSRGLYWFYWNDALKQIDIVQKCMSNASNGNPEPIQVGPSKNLTLYTTIPKGPEDNRKGYRHRNVVDAARRNCNVLLIDCDFTTPYDYFEMAEEVYIVQDLDFIKIQETVDFFKDMKAKQFDWGKFKLIINNKIRCSISTKKIMKTALRYYDDPNMTYTTEFEEIKTFVEFPMEQENYANYLDSMDNGKLNVEKYTPSMKKSLSDLINLIYGMNSGKRSFFG